MRSAAHSYCSRVWLPTWMRLVAHWLTSWPSVPRSLPISPAAVIDAAALRAARCEE